MYYTAPSADFSRPGRTWYPAHGRDPVPAVDRGDHGVPRGRPGAPPADRAVHDLRDRLTRFQRQLGTYPGTPRDGRSTQSGSCRSSATWRSPDYLLGMLSAQAFRAMRVVVDIGLHLQLEIPRTESYAARAASGTWRPALPFVNRYCGRRTPRLRPERARVGYCGMPAQAISYKVGERAWLDIRAQMRARLACSLRSEAIPHGRAQPRVAPARLAPAGVARVAAREVWCGGAPAPRHQFAAMAQACRPRSAQRDR